MKRDSKTGDAVLYRHQMWTDTDLQAGQLTNSTDQFVAHRTLVDGCDRHAREIPKAFPALFRTALADQNPASMADDDCGFIHFFERYFLLKNR